MHAPTTKSIIQTSNPIVPQPNCASTQVCLSLSSYPQPLIRALDLALLTFVRACSQRAAYTNSTVHLLATTDVHARARRQPQAKTKNGKQAQAQIARARSPMGTRRCKRMHACMHAWKCSN
eukprot:6191471-Pleurochrysis_carterae.AAC.5